MRILFIDAGCPAPYDERSLMAGALGGTEGTVVRVAEELAKRHQVTVAQTGRSGSYAAPSGVRYTDFSVDHPVSGKPQRVILLNSHKLLKRVARHHPEAKRYLWMHCYPGKNKKHLARWARRYSYTLLGVSKTHHDHLRGFLCDYQINAQVATPRSLPPLDYIYNPIAEHLGGTKRPYDRNKLVYFSSPHKGLDQILEHFKVLHALEPKLELHLANPGYIALNDNLPAGVRVLGALPQREVHRHVAGALCVFNPQSSFAETFGLVFAEANALGTPVLAHDIGAAEEILGGPEQLVDAEDSRAVAERILAWRTSARPLVSARPEFRASNVARAWERLLGADSRRRTPARLKQKQVHVVP